MSLEKNNQIPVPENVDTNSEIDYVAYVESHNFGEYKKAAIDLAELLSLPGLKLEGDEYSIKSTASKRQKVFDYFCSVCVKAGVELPDLEKKLFQIYLPTESSDSRDREKISKIEGIKTFLSGQINPETPKETKDLIQSLFSVMSVFSKKFDTEGSFNAISTNEIIAVINDQLIKTGLQPIRPDYEKIQVPGSKEVGPKEESTIVIADDDFSEVINTALSLAGWPNLKIKYHIHKRAGYKEEVNIPETISRIAKELAEIKPTLVLMDQGLDNDLEGSDVVSELLKLDSEIVCVANTGGEDSKLRNAGAYPNFEKGRRVSGLRTAIEALR